MKAKLSYLYENQKVKKSLVMKNFLVIAEEINREKERLGIK